LEATGTAKIEAIEILKPVFYRKKALTVIGKIYARGGFMPLVIALK